jgi:hypothetical protein
MNARIGICLGVVNAFVYLVLISVVAYTLGYFTTQVAKPDNDGFALRMLNHLNNNLRDTGFVRAAAHFSPAGGFYYDACDLLGDIFANPLRQGKLSSYPPFLPLTERDEFKKLGEMEFQKFWQGRPSLGEAWNDEQLKPLITDGELYTNVVAMLEGDLKDLTGYFETGRSPKYEEDKILGRWKFDSALSYSYTKRNKPEMTLNEMRRIRTLLAGLKDTTFLATVDKKAVLRIALPGRPVAVQGTWKNNGGGRFGLRMRDPDNRSVDVETRVDNDRLTFAWLGSTFVMERFEK